MLLPNMEVADPKSPIPLDEGIRLKSYQGPLYTLRYIPLLRGIGLFGDFGTLRLVALGLQYPRIKECAP